MVSVGTSAQSQARLASEPLTLLRRAAYDFYLRGRHEWRRVTPAGNRAALQYYDQAIQRDPKYALAWSGIAQTLGAALGHLVLGHVLSQLDQQEEARLMMRRARELDPIFPLTYALSSQVAFQARDFTEAQELARQTIAIDPQFWVGYMQLGQALEQLNDLPAAVATLDHAIRYSGGNSKPRALRAYVLARMGRSEEASAVLAEFEASASQRYVPPYALALINAGLGREDDARRWLELAFTERDIHLGFLPVDPKWDAWRKAPWFVSLLDRCQFAT